MANVFHNYQIDIGETFSQNTTLEQRRPQRQRVMRNSVSVIDKPEEASFRAEGEPPLFG
jgi:hypothetical protein